MIICLQRKLYTFEHTARPGHFSVALRDELERFFPVMEKERVDGCECEDGIIFNHFDSSFESWLFSDRRLRTLKRVQILSRQAT